jgi:putative transcriptional regulator
MDSTELKPPLLLLAMPQVLDPFFHKSVILLLHHEDEGSLGFILNCPTDVKIKEILDDLEIPWAGEQETPAFFGGPVEPRQGTLIYNVDEAETTDQDETARVVFPGVALSQHVGDLKLLAEGPPESFRLLLGYAGWGEGQLVQEILRNDWLVAPPRLDLVFGQESEEAWREALASVGVNADQLSSWTNNDDMAAN